MVYEAPAPVGVRARRVGPAGAERLIIELQLLCRKGRRWLIAFDAEARPFTAAKVAAAAGAFTRALRPSWIYYLLIKSTNKKPLKINTYSPMQVSLIKFGVLLFVSATILALSNASPVQSLPQWEKVKGKFSDFYYNFNWFKSPPNGVKQVDVYYTKDKGVHVVYIFCPIWRFNLAGDTEWNIIPPGSIVEDLAYKLCGKS